VGLNGLNEDRPVAGAGAGGDGPDGNNGLTGVSQTSLEL
jgi:hypothetical protein